MWRYLERNPLPAALASAAAAILAMLLVLVLASLLQLGANALLGGTLKDWSL